MLTITFLAYTNKESNKESEKEVISCDGYRVTNLGEIQEVEVFKGIGEEAKCENYVVSPNSDFDWHVAFVTNLAGKTIDRIGGAS